jgi:sporulation protein YlmC with PRC-barrel domain
MDATASGSEWGKTMTTDDETRPARLDKLSDTGQTVADPAEDIRGRSVKDKEGGDIGTVADLLVDSERGTVRFLLVEHGGILGFGATPSFIPVEAIARITEDCVYISQSGEQVAAAPRYDPDLADESQYYKDLYGYYGYPPFWTPGYMYPGYPPLRPPRA